MMNRRKFLKMLGVGAAALPAISIAAKLPQKSDLKWKAMPISKPRCTIQGGAFSNVKGVTVLGKEAGCYFDVRDLDSGETYEVSYDIRKCIKGKIGNRQHEFYIADLEGVNFMSNSELSQIKPTIKLDIKRNRICINEDCLLDNLSIKVHRI